ncbi:hypothetical protein L228DRAFT_225342 [Xylona heveae TC161]|uniref:RIC1 C-terminal alpha solenoid region domain-containing protein n=1 Tax=Xylona heveae (strain CBS 132557 / TC161) TaxID=1328760 RepID=A0A164Z9K2_XYLHT|nr:hypothetical protein L228DRAFT_225342 [Xylona heveae TC161]KZF18847.1 hypothetical protein L228DRAFT_225342 [Xylona heveae TC161]
MYWPIGAPRIYNAANITPRTQLIESAGVEPVVVETDDIPDTSTIASTVDNSEAETQSIAEESDGGESVYPGTRSNSNGVKQSSGEDLIGGLEKEGKVGRSGSEEAVITGGQSGRSRGSSLRGEDAESPARRRGSSLKETHDGNRSKYTAKRQRKPSYHGSGSKRGSAASTTQSDEPLQEERDYPSTDNARILALQVSRNGRIFATITSNSLTIWQAKPTAVLATVTRPVSSIDVYGENIALLLRPDSAIIVVQTSLGYLITYSLATDPNSRVYKLHRLNAGGGSSRRQSVSGYGGYHYGERQQRLEEGVGIMEVSLRFRMVIKIDAGISKALALDDELVVATSKPAAVQCIRWTPDSNGTQTSTELLSRMQWFARKTRVVDMLHDRPMNLSTWIASDGKAYAVQKMPNSMQEPGAPKKLFRGYCFHTPANRDEYAVKAAINARFSLIAIGCANGGVIVYNARDYVGNIPVSHKLQLPVSLASSGPMTFLSYSPDGYCLFAGFAKGWMMWSVYGKPAGSSFSSERLLSETNEEEWLLGVRDGSWINGGFEILLLAAGQTNLFVLEMARSALTTLFSSANVSHSLLLTDTGLMVYRGHNMSDLTAISAESSVWHNVQIPPSYLVNQWPIRSAVVSPDGRYIAVAGRRGLAHYSVHSGRWKTFNDPAMEDEFIVRGGMCWHQHVLIAAVETGMYFQLRLYSRELALDNSLILHTESIPAPIVLIARSGEDSLLVYTYENILYHYIIAASSGSIRLVQVGQIALHGIIRAPARVRAVSWLLPEAQIQDGDPSQDVKVATVLFLVDGKLVLLCPSTTEAGGLKYDMRIIAQNIEYYALMRDQLHVFRDEGRGLGTPLLEKSFGGFDLDLGSEHDLRDSLWTFDGDSVKVWPDVKEVLQAPSSVHAAVNGVGEAARNNLPPTVSISFDFYPLSVVLERGVIIGLEADLVQRRDISFAFFRMATRTHLFIPPLLRHILTHPHPDHPNMLSPDPDASISPAHPDIDLISDSASSNTPNPVSPHPVSPNPISPNPFSSSPSPFTAPTPTTLTTAPNPSTTTIPAALHMASFFQHLPYFPHALEMLLHNVLDDEVDAPSPSPETALLPVVISFLAMFPDYLDIIVQCTRKTEVRSWRTLFQYLPSPQTLFEESLARNALKTAGGYLLVLHTFEELGPLPSPGSSDSHSVTVSSSGTSSQLVTLLRRAVDEQDWDLCKELARFLTALDPSGSTLRDALEVVRLGDSHPYPGPHPDIPEGLENREAHEGPGSPDAARSVQSAGNAGNARNAPSAQGNPFPWKNTFLSPTSPGTTMAAPLRIPRSRTSRASGNGSENGTGNGSAKGSREPIGLGIGSTGGSGTGGSGTGNANRGGGDGNGRGRGDGGDGGDYFFSSSVD